MFMQHAEVGDSSRRYYRVLMMAYNTITRVFYNIIHQTGALILFSNAFKVKYERLMFSGM
jgi:hypothetical protein